MVCSWWWVDGVVVKSLASNCNVVSGTISPPVPWLPKRATFNLDLFGAVDTDSHLLPPPPSPPPCLPVLVGLYEEPERPSNAVDYIKRYMGAPTNVDVEAIRAENESLKTQIQTLTNDLAELQKQVSGGCPTSLPRHDRALDMLRR